MIANRLRQLLNLHPGEERQAFLFASIAFLWATAIFSGVTLADGLFLESIGARSLPYYYLTSAVIMPLFAMLIFHLLNFFKIDHIFLGILVAAGAIYMSWSFFFYEHPFFETKYFAYTFKLLCTALCSITLSAFWSFTDQFYDMQKAKRVFCLFNSMVYFGDSIGGLLVALLLPLAGIKALLVTMAVLLFSSLFLVKKASSSFTRVLDEVKEEDVAERNSIASFFKSLLTSPFALAFVGLTLLTYLICSVTEFNYQLSFEKAFKANGQVQEHQLTIFMGKCAFFVSLANTLFGLTCYSRIVKRIGVNNLAPITSVMFIMLFTSWHLVDHLLIAVIGFAIVEGVVYAIDDNNFNLLLNAVPTKIKYAVRVFLDSFIEHIGLAIGGLILLFSSPDYYLFLGLLLSFICLFTVLILKSAYPKAIYQNLVETAIYFEKTLKCFFEDMTQEKKDKTQVLLLANISRSRPCFLSYETLLRLDKPDIIPKLIRRAEFLSLSDKLTVIKLFEKSPYKTHPKFIACLNKWLHTYSEEKFRNELLFYLAKFQKLTLETALSLMHSSDLSFQITGSLGILKSINATEEVKEEAFSIFYQGLKSSQSEHTLKALEGIQAAFDERFLTHLDRIFDIQNTEIQVTISEILATHLNEKHAFLEDLIFQQINKTSASKTRINLIKALMRFKSPAILIRLIKATAHFRTKEKAQLEILSVSLAIQIPEKLLDMAIQASSHHRCRILALRILKLVHPQILELHCDSLLKKELHRANFYKKKAFLLSQFPVEEVDKLMTALKAAKQSSMELLTHLLLIDSPMEKIDTFIFSLSSKNKKIRSNAIESLEKACPPKHLEALDSVFTLPSTLFYTKGQHDLWRVLRLLYNELRFSLASIDVMISSLVEKQYLFPNIDLPYHQSIENQLFKPKGPSDV